MKCHKRYYFHYRSDNYMSVVIFTTRYAAKIFTERRRRALEGHSHITFDIFSVMLSRKQALAYSTNNKIYTNWQVAVGYFGL